MEDKDIKIIEQLDKIYDLLNVACGNCIIEDEERDSMQEAICSIQKKYKQDEKVIEEMADYISDLDIDEAICCKRTSDCYIDVFVENGCRKCIIDYFRKKCE